MGADSSSIGLIVATLDLQLVRLLRQASAGSAAADGARGHIHPQPRIEPRPVHHPEPRIEPRRSIEPAPRFEPRPTVFIDLPPSCVPAPLPPCEPEKGENSISPLQPPWKTLPWENPIPPAPKVKVVQYRPDIITKGSLIDFFI